ncbi:MAG: acylneuraminate cytidylyltransferase family protein [Desulfobacteraceae bacterium]|nr:acylneuraminate cytidylyltransferase family protein [Desulfobacteraceae bacterium]
MKKSCLCLIPAKGGSTRLKRKNIAEIEGKPLIAYPIENAKKTGLCGRIIVSTEDDEIAKISRKYGAEVPFIRPLELAKDPATISDVCLHALEALDPEGNIYKTLVVLLPTAPLCTHKDIINAFKIFNEKKGQFLLSVTAFDSPPYNALRYNDDGESLISCFPESEFRYTKSTECPKALRSNGAIVIVSISAFKKNRSFWGKPLLAYEMPPERSIDIDTKFELELARFFMQDNLKKIKK